MKPPRPVKIVQTETHHGFVKTDEYSWLRAANWQEVMRDPNALQGDIRDHLEAENAYTKHVLAASEGLRQKLFAEIRARVEENSSTVPTNYGDYAWNSRFREGDEHPLLCRGKRDCNPDETETIVDCNQLADGRAYFKLIGSESSDDTMRMALAMDFTGGEFLTIKVCDTHSKTFLGDTLEGASEAMAWSEDAEFLFYILLDDNHRPYKVMRHQIGQSQKDDICVYEEKSVGFFLSLSKTASGRFIIIHVYDHETSECWLIDAGRPQDPPRCVAPRKAGIQYYIDDDAERDQLVIMTNWQEQGRAEDFQMVTAPIENTEQSRWKTIVAHQPGHLILDFNAYAGFLVLLIRANALPFARVFNLGNGTQQDIAFDEPVYDLTLHSNSEYASETLRFTYSSMTTPAEIYDYDMAKGTRQLRKAQIVPSGHNSEDFISQRLWAPGHDGVKIPMSVFFHKDTPLDGTAPVILFGYGAYGITLAASFSIARISLVERGFIFAIAHIRGSKACGHHWFEQGRREKKQNTFKDFIAAAEHLIAIGYTTRGNISTYSGSAGGLLVGACVNMAPDLFRSAVAEVPFVDTLSTMLDETLPLTPPEWPEWGNPKANKADYETIAAYAPYENIKAQNYPHILATAGLTDPRVTYWEPAKWVARLRDHRTDDGLTLFKTEMQAGHGGPAGRFNQLKETAFVYSFMLHCHGERNSSDG